MYRYRHNYRPINFTTKQQMLTAAKHYEKTRQQEKPHHVHTCVDVAYSYNCGVVSLSSTVTSFK